MTENKDITPEILCTKEYGLFGTHKMQRSLKPAHVAKIQASMKRYGVDPTQPVVVNKMMEIVDGQHRYQAAMNLGLCIYYTYSQKSIEQVREEAGTVMRWDMTDFVTSHIRQGNKDYKRILELKELSGLGWEAFMRPCFTQNALGGGDLVTFRQTVRSGKLIVTDTKEAEILLFLERFNLFRGVFRAWNHRNFTVACAFVFSHPKYLHQQMEQRLEYQTRKMVPCVSVSEYIVMLADIYNFNSAEKNRVDFSRAARGMR